MAINEGSSKTISRSIDSYRRIKQQLRDYTIPVRLSQLPPATATEAANGNEEFCCASGNCDSSSAFLLPSASSSRLFQSKRQHESLKNQIMRLVVDKISAQSNKRLSTQQTATKCSSKMTVTLVAAIALLTLSAKACHCDTQQQPPTSLKDSSPPSLSASSSSALVSSKSPATAVLAKISTSSKTHPSVGSSSGGHRENLLSILTDSIERQHFKIKPVRAFVQQRPSKFDSGEEYSSVEFGEAAANFIQKASSRTKQQHQIQHHSSSSGGGSSMLNKNDDSMKQILRMHEQLASQSATNNRPASSLSPPETPDESSSPSSNNDGIAGKWRELTRTPARVASSLVVNPNKMVSQVLSYITPLVGPKLLEHGPLSGLLKSAPIAVHSVSTSNNTSIATRFRLNPFVGRSNNQASGGGFFGDQSQAGTEGDSTTQKSFMGSVASTFVTALPLTSYLVKPEPIKSMASNINSNRQQQTFPSTQPTKFLDYLDTTNKYEVKVAARRPDMYSKDLLMADSNPQTSTSSLSPAPGSDEKAQNSISTSSNNNKQPAGIPKGGLRGTSAWLKATTNPMTQNYIQDSLRGLLTLSQLPILSADRPSSATASRLFGNKGSQQQRPSTTSQLDDDLKSHNQWKRNLEEVYRLAYILATGTRRKKDPLLALESSSPATTQVSLSSSSSLSQNKPFKRGVFSQRSLNELVAANRKQFLNYIRKMKSNLATKPGGLQSDSNKFKPRGVMWDMATDPTLAVTVFHLLERASIALPLGFLLMPFVKMIHNPLSGMDLRALLPARATHRSVDYEELAKQLDFVDKMLSRALRPTHREA